jgi:alcohol dehydrogenase class IV
MSDLDFRWRDGERLVRFGRGALAEARELVGDGYSLLTTERAAATAPALAERAARTYTVPAGRVDEVATAMRERVKGELLVALGGGRVIDVAKALAAADPPRRVAAIPTTLSAAEMTASHRHAAGVGADRPRVRPAIVVNDPGLSASQPERDLGASALNALGHAVEAPVTTLANPVSTLAALDAARRIVLALATAEPEREQLALGALLSGYAIDSARYGLHHVASQTLAREAGVGHGQANALLLPHTLEALRRRDAAAVERLAGAIGGDPIEVAAALRARTGVERLRDTGVDAERLAACAEAAAARSELALTPPAAGRDELLGIYEAAW